MVVGIDVHKHAHVAALLDERGGEIDTLGFTNSPAGMRKLCGWLAGHDAADAVVGVESPAGYGRLLVASLEAAGPQGAQRARLAHPPRAAPPRTWQDRSR